MAGNRVTAIIAKRRVNSILKMLKTYSRVKRDLLEMNEQTLKTKRDAEVLKT
jgi:hypothetical protein